MSCFCMVFSWILDENENDFQIIAICFTNILQSVPAFLGLDFFLQTN